MKAPEIVYDADGEIDMDWWMTLSDEQIAAIEEQQEREHVEFWNSLTVLQKYRIRRRMCLESILRTRKLLAEYPFLADLDTFKHDGRVTLVRLREFLRTGIEPTRH